jgi:hypothetical protein
MLKLDQFTKLGIVTTRFPVTLRVSSAKEQGSFASYGYLKTGPAIALGHLNCINQPRFQSRWYRV